jgi:sugar phosphate isomerase/epimerase
MLYMHSYTYRGQPLERAARKCRQYGYDGLELVTGHYDRTRPAESIREAAKAATQAGTRIAVVDFSGSLIAEAREEREATRAAIAEVIRLAGEIGAVGVNGSVGSLVGPNPHAWSENGSRLATQELYERAAGELRLLAATAEEAGIWISLEIHMNTPHDTAASAHRLLELVGSARVVANLDPGNMYGVEHAEPIARAVEVLGPHLGYVHLKNCRRLAGHCDYSWPLEGGDIDYARGFREILAAGYVGDWCIEYCGAGDPSVPARRDAEYFRATLWEAGQP